MIYNPKKPDGKNVLTIATETELRAYIENARRHAAKNGGACNDG